MRDRRPRSRQPRRADGRRILVVTEGTVTEPQYVQGLNAYLRTHGVTATVKTIGVGQDPVKVVENCIDLRESEESKGKEYAYDTCICLVDADRHLHLEEACRRAQEEGILLLVSNLKFEVWLRWHKERKDGRLSSRELDTVVNKLGLVKGKRLVARFPFENVDTAYSYASQVDPGLASGRRGPDPSSAMPILVDLMKGKEVV